MTATITFSLWISLIQASEGRPGDGSPGAGI